MKKTSIRLLFVLLTLIVVAIPLMAKDDTGGVKISNTSVSCGDVNKETKEVCGTLRVWINVSSKNANTPSSSWQWQNTDKGKTIASSNFSGGWNSCGDGYYYSDISTGGASGTHTLQVSNGGGLNIGSDTWVIPDTCD